MDINLIKSLMIKNYYKNYLKFSKIFVSDDISHFFSYILISKG